jgi:hypothetical protein
MRDLFWIPVSISSGNLLIWEETTHLSLHTSDIWVLDLSGKGHFLFPIPQSQHLGIWANQNQLIFNQKNQFQSPIGPAFPFVQSEVKQKIAR